MNLNDVSGVYENRKLSYSNMKQIAGLLLIFMWTELGVHYSNILMDPSLLTQSWNSLINTYISYQLSIEEWIDFSLRHIKNSCQNEANCWEFIRSYICLYFGIFKRCEAYKEYSRQVLCVEEQYIRSWTYFVNKYIHQ